ncbi:hypothetical protein AHAS_Ahas08G0004200 [Arachis hypogaea]
MLILKRFQFPNTFFQFSRLPSLFGIISAPAISSRKVSSSISIILASSAYSAPENSIEWLLAMPTQPMNAIKQLRRINQKLSNFAFGANIGIILIFHLTEAYLVVNTNTNFLFSLVMQDFGRSFDKCSSCRVPMYSEAKLAFFIYLWYPKTKGTTYVYDSFFRPYVAKHESEIDRNLSELKTRAGDVAVLYWQRAASYGQTRIVDILQYVAAQSTPAPPPAQQRPGARVRQTAPANHQPAAATEIQAEDPPSPTSRSSLSQQQKEVAEMSSSQVPKAVLSAAGISTQNPTPQLINQSAAPAETEPMQINAANESENPSTEETVMEESIRGWWTKIGVNFLYDTLID